MNHLVLALFLVLTIIAAALANNQAHQNSKIDANTLERVLNRFQSNSVFFETVRKALLTHTDPKLNLRVPHSPVAATSGPTKFSTVKYYYSTTPGQCPSPTAVVLAIGLDYCTPVYDKYLKTVDWLYVTVANGVASWKIFNSNTCTGNPTAAGTIPIGECTSDNIKVTSPSTGAPNYGSLSGIKYDVYSSSSGCQAQSSVLIGGSLLTTKDATGCLVADTLSKPGFSYAYTCSGNSITQTYWNTSSTCKNTPAETVTFLDTSLCTQQIDFGLTYGYPYVNCFDGASQPGAEGEK